MKSNQDEQKYEKRTCTNSFFMVASLKWGCYFLANIQMVISVVLFFGTIVLVWNEKEIKDTESTFRGIFLLTMLAVISALLYIADFTVHFMFLMALRKERLRQIKICLVYSIGAPLIEISRILVCLDFNFLVESSLFIVCFIMRLYWAFIVYNYRRQLLIRGFYPPNQSLTTPMQSIYSKSRPSTSTQ